jgi:hypothetical protein
MLISLHMPKTAGNSFLQALETRFGESLQKDYSDMPRIQQYLAGNLSPQELTEFKFAEHGLNLPQCIHGHFLPAKYVYACKQEKCDMRFITWLRDPVERLMSHYYFFKRSYDPRTAGPLFRKIIEENWSLERFCFSEEYKNLYRKYMWNFPYELFDFVGLTEFYEDDLRYFSDIFLKTKVDAQRLNCAVDRKAGGYELDAGFRREVENFHSEDVALYKRALHGREQRG